MLFLFLKMYLHSGDVNLSLEFALSNVYCNSGYSVLYAGFVKSYSEYETVHRPILHVDFFEYDVCSLSLINHWDERAKFLLKDNDVFPIIS